MPIAADALSEISPATLAPKSFHMDMDNIALAEAFGASQNPLSPELGATGRRKWNKVAAIVAVPQAESNPRSAMPLIT